jgi:hypothetical protein
MVGTMPRAGGGPVGPPALEIKLLRIYISEIYNYLKIFIMFSLCNGNFKFILSLIHLIGLLVTSSHWILMNSK